MERRGGVGEPPIRWGVNDGSGSATGYLFKTASGRRLPVSNTGNSIKPVAAFHREKHGVVVPESDFFEVRPRSQLSQWHRYTGSHRTREVCRTRPPRQLAPLQRKQGERLGA
jgi:hypothetical protein